MDSINNLDCLAEHIKKALKDGKSIKDLKHLLVSYKGTDWEKYINICPNRYTRNKVYCDTNCGDRTAFEIMVLCWDKGQTSGIHDHPKYGCIVKVLQGELEENIYGKNKLDKLEHLHKQVLREGQCSFQIGKMGLHNVSNPSAKNFAVSLHIYSPPNYKSTKY